MSFAVAVPNATANEDNEPWPIHFGYRLCHEVMFLDPAQDAANVNTLFLQLWRKYHSQPDVTSAHTRDSNSCCRMSYLHSLIGLAELDGLNEYLTDANFRYIDTKWSHHIPDRPGVATICFNQLIAGKFSSDAIEMFGSVVATGRPPLFCLIGCQRREYSQAHYQKGRFSEINLNRLGWPHRRCSLGRGSLSIIVVAFDTATMSDISS